MGMISHEQFDRIAERARDASRRTFTSGAEANAQPVDFDELFSDLEQHGAPGAQGLLGAFGKLGGLFGGAGGVIAMGPVGTVRFGGEPPPAGLAPPPGDERLAEAGRRIGRPLPDELRQLYAIGDGGFGPGAGLLPLDRLVARYLDLTREPFGPMGQDWPANLLPLFDQDPALLCLDLDDGGVVAWDPEEIEDEESEGDWLRSFVPEQPSLAALMEQWLGQPTFEEEARKLEREIASGRNAGKPSPVTGFPMQLDDPAEQAEAEVVFLRYSPELRDDFGLPEVGWEDEIRRRHGLA